MALYSIGHSNLRADALVRLLQQHQIKFLADVRSKPFSRWNPQFNRGSLMGTLLQAHIVYAWYPILGGLDGTSTDAPEFIEAMDELIEAARTQNIALMCSERDPQDCHRHTKLGTWAARERGVHLTHIVPGTLPKPVQAGPQKGLFE